MASSLTAAEDESDLIVPSAVPSGPIGRKRLQRRRELDQKNTCGICFGVATPAARLDGCAHRHCFTCIVKLATTSNRCPYCRKRFHLIVDETDPTYTMEFEDVDPPSEPLVEAGMTEGEYFDENGDEAWGCAGCGSNHDED